MSWLAKAESLLTALDATAATKIQQVKSTSTPNRRAPPSEEGENVYDAPTNFTSSVYTSPSTYRADAYSTNERPPSASYSSSRRSSTASSSRHTTGGKADNEEHLIDYLNSESPAPGARRTETPDHTSIAVDEDDSGVNHPVIKANRQQGVIRELNEQILQLKNQLSTKDSHLSVLKVRAAEASDGNSRLTADNESLRLKVTALKESQSTDASTTEGIDGQIAKLQMDLSTEKSAHQSLKTSTDGRLHGLQHDLQAVGDERDRANRLLADERARATQLQSDIRECRQTSVELRTELDDYKAKAVRVLQAKEESMRQMSPDSAADGGVLRAQVDELMVERDALAMHCKDVNLKHAAAMVEQENLRDAVAMSERAMAQERAAASDEVTTVRARLTAANEQLLGMKEERKDCLDDQGVQHEMMVQKLREKDVEIERLLMSTSRENVTDSSTASLTRQVEEGKTRQRHMTERMLQMQGEMEAARGDLHACRAEVERCQDSAREAERSAITAQRAVHNSNPSALPRSRANIPAILRENPYDASVVRSLKRGYGHVDTAASQLFGLVRHPVGRVGSFVYLILLHAWALIILATYTPEIHNHEGDFQPPASG